MNHPVSTCVDYWVDYCRETFLANNSVQHPLSLCSSLFLQGEKGTPGERVSHAITSLSSYCRTREHNDSQLLSLSADRDLQESAAGWP